MKKNTALFLLAILIPGGALYAEITQQLWGEIGYILDLNRVKEGSESSIDGRNDGERVDEIDRWLAGQTAYVSMYFSYHNMLELGSDFTLDLNDLSSTSLPELVKVLYVSASPTDWCNLTFGKQRLKWGTARVFNAIDKLETIIDPFGVRSLREGVSGIKAVFTPLEWMSLSLLALPDSEFRWSRFAGRLDILFLDIDAGFGVIKYNYSNLEGVDTAAAPAAAQTSDLDRCALFFDAIRYFDNLGLYAEFEYRFSRENEYAFKDITAQYRPHNGGGFTDVPVFRLTCGITYTMEESPYLTLMAEYFYNSEGFSNAEAREFYRSFGIHRSLYPSDPVFLPQTFGTFGSFRRHYVCLGVTGLQAPGFMSVGLLVLSNPETLAFDFAPQVTLDINKSVFFNLRFEYLHQFLDKDEYPSELNFLDYNFRITFCVTTNFLMIDYGTNENSGQGPGERGAGE
jgi:hypothetical protein